MFDLRSKILVRSTQLLRFGALELGLGVGRVQQQARLVFLFGRLRLGRGQLAPRILELQLGLHSLPHNILYQ